MTIGLLMSYEKCGWRGLDMNYNLHLDEAIGRLWLG